MALSVGFIGVGNMGNPMAGNVLKGGFPMLVFDLNPKAMENLIQAGARRARSAQEVVEGSEVVLTSLPASPDVEAMYLEPGGLVERAKPGTILIDLSSVLPSTLRKLEPKATDLAYAELQRRLGFEENGILLHELYFGNLAAEPDPMQSTPLLSRKTP